MAYCNYEMTQLHLNQCKFVANSLEEAYTSSNDIVKKNNGTLITLTAIPTEDNKVAVTVDYMSYSIVKY